MPIGDQIIEIIVKKIVLVMNFLEEHEATCYITLVCRYSTVRLSVGLASSRVSW